MESNSLTNIKQIQVYIIFVEKVRAEIALLTYLKFLVLQHRYTNDCSVFILYLNPEILYSSTFIMKRILNSKFRECCYYCSYLIKNYNKNNLNNK